MFTPISRVRCRKKAMDARRVAPVRASLAKWRNATDAFSRGNPKVRADSDASLWRSSLAVPAQQRAPFRGLHSKSASPQA